MCLLFQVKIWFQNRRMKWRNSKERELLASGGSRDQTLPNKNNPNPDLSDARTDRPPSLSPNSEPASPSTENTQQSHSMEAFTVAGGTSIKSPDNKFQSDTIARKAVLEQLSPGKAENLFKMEFDENRPNQQHIFNNFYEKVRDINNSMVFNNNRTSNNGGNNMNLYYDEYESRSDDSDEEISVT